MTRLAPGLTRLAAALAALAPSGAYAADKFCEQIQAIVADAPNGFAAFQGQLVKKETFESKVVEDYAASGAPDGAAACEIVLQQPGSDGRRYPNYSCEFPATGADKGVATRKLATQVSACLPGISRPIGPGLDKSGGMLTAHSSDYSVGYSFLSGPAKPMISFSVQSERK